MENRIGMNSLKYESAMVSTIVLAAAIALFAATSLIFYAVTQRNISATRGAYLILLIALFALSFTFFLHGVLRGGRLAVESNWGGLGGGLSGWHISAPFAFLLLSIGLFALLVAAISTETAHPNLWERYGAALNFAGQNGFKFERSEVIGGKLLLKGTAPSQPVADEFWNLVKLANPLHDDIAPDLSIIKTPAGAPSTTGTVK